MLEERKYNVMQKYQYFNGVKFTRDEKSGYYLNSSIRKRMHRYVWEYYNGEIPEGYQIHHIDKDRSNNDISNLELIPFTEHAKLHNKEKAITRHAEIVQNIKENVLPKAIEWHKSDEGRQWHSEKAKAQMDERAYKTFICEECGKHFESKAIQTPKYCCNACKSKARRRNRTDDETRICKVCGKEFMTNKYKNVITCGRTCANKLRTLK